MMELLKTILKLNQFPVRWQIADLGKTDLDLSAITA